MEFYCGGKNDDGELGKGDYCDGKTIFHNTAHKDLKSIHCGGYKIKKYHFLFFIFLFSRKSYHSFKK
jgi:hypothetical protein